MMYAGLFPAFSWHERAGMRSLPDGFRMYEARLPNGSDYIDLQFYLAPVRGGGGHSFIAEASDRGG